MKLYLLIEVYSAINSIAVWVLYFVLAWILHLLFNYTAKYTIFTNNNDSWKMTLPVYNMIYYYIASCSINF